MWAQWEEVDGVPALCADSGAIQGPLHACLIFGTGRTSETLRVSGINHAVEHLVLHALSPGIPYSWNGEVDTVSTKFWAVGSPEQVTEFFHAVSGQLRSLPLDRLADELKVLEIESQRRGVSTLDVDLGERFGPHGAGLARWYEYGFDRLEADELVEWVATHFTADNAVMWLSGPLPPALQLRDLPAGPRPAHDELPRLITPGHAFVAMPTRTVSVSCVSEQRSSISLVMEVARRRAQERLRREALSYAVELTTVRVGGGHVLALLQADGTDDGLGSVAGVLADITGELAAAGPADPELEAFREYGRQFRDHPQQRLAQLEDAARIRLLDDQVHTPDHLDTFLDAHTPASLRDDLAAVMPTILMVGPEAVGDQLDGWTAHTDWSEHHIRGTKYQPIPGREQGTMVVGDDGISWVLDRDQRRTIHWADVEACLTTDSGMRSVIGTTGSTIWITPWHWQAGEELAGRIDHAIDAARVIRVGEGSLQFRHPDDDVLTDVRWLATIADARWNARPDDRVSVVIDTDGVFLLYGAYGGADLDRHLRELRAADRPTLLAIHRQNRWIDERDIALVELRRKPWTRVGMLSWTLTIHTVDGAKLTIFLVSDEQVGLAQTHFPRLVGARFRQ